MLRCDALVVRQGALAKRRADMTGRVGRGIQALTVMVKRLADWDTARRWPSLSLSTTVAKRTDSVELRLVLTIRHLYV